MKFRFERLVRQMAKSKSLLEFVESKKPPLAIAEDRGSMIALFTIFVGACLVLSCFAINAGSAYLFKQRLQSKADQLVLLKYANAGHVAAETEELTLCENWVSPLKVIGLPAALEICAHSAAR